MLNKYKVPPDWYDRAIISHNIFHRFWHIKRLKTLISLLNGFNGLILDVGCDGGTLSSIIKQDSVWIVGIDIDMNAIKYATIKRKHHAWILADAHYLPFKNKSFNIVLCIETLEHCYSPRSVIEEIKRVTRSEILILIPNSSSPIFKIIWYVWLKLKGRVWIDSHLYEFNDRTIKKLFNDCGLKVFLMKRTLLGMLLAYKLRE